MVLVAKHKKTGKIVSAEKVNIDTSWLGTEKDEWIARDYDILNKRELLQNNITEVPLTFIKAHDRQVDGIFQRVRSHFRCLNQDVCLRGGSGESSEHKIAKEKVYELLWDKKIKFNCNNALKTIEDFDSFDILIEERLSHDMSSKIADVMIKFEKRDETFGNGIVIEIQFSRQSTDHTYERTWRRVEEGYTVVWLFKDNFDSNMNLKQPVLEVKPYYRLFNEFSEKFKDSLQNTVREISNKIDIKIENFEQYKEVIMNDIEFIKKSSLESIRLEKVTAHQEFENIARTEIASAKHTIEGSLKKILTDTEEELKKEIPIIHQKVRQEIINNIMNESQLKELIKNEIHKSIQEELSKEDIKDEFQEKLKHRINSVKSTLLFQNANEIKSLVNEKAKLIIDRDFKKKMDKEIRESVYLRSRNIIDEFLNKKIGEQEIKDGN